MIAGSAAASAHAQQALTANSFSPLELPPGWLLGDPVLAGPIDAGPVPPVTFSGIGSLATSTPTTRGSAATNLSLDGKTIVGQANSPLGGQAMRWTKRDGIQALGSLPPGGMYPNTALATSADGDTIAGWGKSAASAPYYEAFVWTPQDGMQPLGFLNGPIKLSQALNISADGSTVVGISMADIGLEAFRWTRDRGMEALGVIPGVGNSPTSATAISADGSVIAGYGLSGPSGYDLWRWTADSGMVDLGELPGGSQFASPNGMTPDGRVIVGTSSSELTGTGSEAFRWADGSGWQALGDLSGGATQSVAYAVSADGWVIVGQGTSANGSEAMIWDPIKGMRPLRSWILTFNSDQLAQLGLWKLTAATGISADGTVVTGYGTNPQGVQEGFIATIPAMCYANCDNSKNAPILSANDFTCFLTKFRSGDPYANCDGSTDAPVLTASDFTCFLSKFQSGCP
jgi:uncharacterized membrane protein